MLYKCYKIRDMNKETDELLKEFVKERDWDRFHTPENLAKSISIEAGELLECFQWSSDFEKEHVQEELADVLIYCALLANKLHILEYLVKLLIIRL